MIYILIYFQSILSKVSINVCSLRLGKISLTTLSLRIKAIVICSIVPMQKQHKVKVNYNIKLSHYLINSFLSQVGKS